MQFKQIVLGKWRPDFLVGINGHFSIIFICFIEFLCRQTYIFLDIYTQMFPDFIEVVHEMGYTQLNAG